MDVWLLCWLNLIQLPQKKKKRKLERLWKMLRWFITPWGCLAASSATDFPRLWLYDVCKFSHLLSTNLFRKKKKVLSSPSTNIIHTGNELFPIAFTLELNRTTAQGLTGKHFQSLSQAREINARLMTSYTIYRLDVTSPWPQEIPHTFSPHRHAVDTEWPTYALIRGHIQTE